MSFSVDRGRGPQHTFATLTQDQNRSLFGQVMGLVAVTFAFLAAGAFITRNDVSQNGFIFMLIGLGCTFGIGFASRRQHIPTAITLLFALGLFFGLGLGPVLSYYVHSNPGAVAEAGGTTAGFIAIMGCAGWVTRTDLSAYARVAMGALLLLIVFGIVTLFIAIPGGNIIYCLAGLVIFAFFTAYDFQRLRTAKGMTSAPLLAANIFLDILNAFLFLLSLFGGNGSRGLRRR